MSTGPTRSVGVDKTDRTHSFTGINLVKEAGRAGKTDNSPTEHRQQSQNVPTKTQHSRRANNVNRTNKVNRG